MGSDLTLDELAEKPAMAKVDQLLIFLASPGDVPKERRYVSEVVDDLNRTIASQKGIVLQVVRWENDAFPGYGKDAQALINEQIAAMAKYSLFVGIMWNRLGTPTPRAASGTVEEFERAVAALAQHGQPAIWFYFREPPPKLDTNEQLQQRNKVSEFTKQVQANGMPWSYMGPSDFRNKFHRQMILWANSLDRQAATTRSETVDDEGSESATAAQGVEPSNIPPQTYHHLIGRRDEIHNIMGALREPESKRAIVVAGLGGIGKTALAREVAERCRRNKSFDRVVWASFKKELFVGERITRIESRDYSFDELLSDIFRQCASMIVTKLPADPKQTIDMVQMLTPKAEPGNINRLPPAQRRAAVRTLLNTKRVLIVLDNLETIPNSEELVAAVFEILGQSKLLITSRHQVTDDRVYNINLGGFSEDEGVTFLSEEGKERGIESVASAERSTLINIHDVTGGAPLAMKLVVGQLSRQPMEVVFNTLKEASFQGRDYELYRFIYRYSWEMLDMTARMVLVDMSVFPPLIGGAVKDVQSISQVGGRDFWSAMDQLVRLSLVDKSGLAGEERFFLHALTSNFIRSDITKEKEWAE
jgi:NB-ARC domain